MDEGDIVFSASDSQRNPSPLKVIDDTGTFIYQTQNGSAAKTLISSEDRDYMQRSSRLYQFDALWQCYFGEGIRIAVIDTGLAVVETDKGLKPHPAFPADSILRCVRFANGKQSVGLAAVRDENGHGTHCAGLVAGRPLRDDNFGRPVACEPRYGKDTLPSKDFPRVQNDPTVPRTEGEGRDFKPKWHAVLCRAGTEQSGERLDVGNPLDEEALDIPFRGVAPRAKLMIYKVSNAKNRDTDDGNARLEDIAQAIYDAVNHNADIISISMSAEISADLLYGAVHKALGMRKDLVCSDGNEG
ncbi:MAG: S8 family serine peptidase [Geminicoccaceae bacterium]